MADVDGSVLDAAVDMIRWRVQGNHWERDGKTQANWVAYLSSVDVAVIMDRWVAQWGGSWSDEYRVYDNGKVAECAVSVRLEDGTWVTRRDVGVASDFEAEKGLISDAFKRAATIKWGAGRNVYHMPIVAAPVRAKKAPNGKFRYYETDDTQRVLMKALEAHGHGFDQIVTDNPDTHDEVHDDGESDGVAPQEPWEKLGWESEKQCDEVHTRLAEATKAAGGDAGTAVKEAVKGKRYKSKFTPAAAVDWVKALWPHLDDEAQEAWPDGWMTDVAMAAGHDVKDMPYSKREEPF